MKKIIILIPVYNDWESLTKLLNEINSVIAEINGILFECLIIDDASTTKLTSLKKPKKLSSLKVLHMKKNMGHARSIAFGIRHLVKKGKFDYLILMDGDGEDRPKEIKLLVDRANLSPNISVVARRVKRSEGIIFQFLYQVHKIITIIFTGKNINFGNYSCVTYEDAIKISNKPSLWSSFSGTLKNYVKPLNEIASIRAKRYFGPSKMSLYNLVIHSFSIIAVFKRNVFIRSIILLFLFSLISSKLSMFLIVIMQIAIVCFNLTIFLVSMRESEKDLIESHLNYKETSNIIN